LAKLVEVREYARSHRIAFKRREPAKAYLCGAAGTGKSSFATQLAARLIKDKYPEVTEQQLYQYIYYRQPTSSANKFWQGFGDDVQAVIFDDKGTVTEKTAAAAEESEWHIACGDGAFFPPQAEIHDKRTPFTANILIACSNQLFPNFGNGDYKAMARRISPWIFVRRRRDANGELMALDHVQFTHLEFFMVRDVGETFTKEEMKDVSNETLTPEILRKCRVVTPNDILEVMQDQIRAKQAFSGKFSTAVFHSGGADSEDESDGTVTEVTDTEDECGYETAAPPSTPLQGVPEMCATVEQPQRLWKRAELNEMPLPEFESTWYSDGAGLSYLMRRRKQERKKTEAIMRREVLDRLAEVAEEPKTSCWKQWAVFIGLVVGLVGVAKLVKSGLTALHKWLTGRALHAEDISLEELIEQSRQGRHRFSEAYAYQFNIDIDDEGFAKPKKGKGAGSNGGDFNPDQSGGAKNHSLNPRLMKLMQNLMGIQFADGTAGYAYSVGGHTVLVPRHYQRVWAEDKPIKFSFIRPAFAKECVVPKEKIVVWQDKDLVALEIENMPARAHTGIGVKPEACESFTCFDTSGMVTINVNVVGVQRVMFRYRGEAVTNTVIAAKLVDAYEAGDCGRVLFGRRRDNCVYVPVGMYIGADKKYSYFSSFDDVNLRHAAPESHSGAVCHADEGQQSLLDLYGLEFLFREGRVEHDAPTLAQRGRNNIIPSCFAGVVQDPVTLPTKLTAEAEMKAFKKKDCKPVPVDMKALDAVVNTYVRKLKEVVGPCRILDEEEALSGHIREGLELAQIDLTTSAGYPYVSMGLKKAQLVELDTFGGRQCPRPIGELRKRVDEQWKQWNEEQLGSAVYSANLKVERRETERVNQGKTRLFSAGPFHKVINDRRAVGYFHAQWANARFWHSYGIAAQTLEWDRLAKKLLMFNDKFGAYDYSGYDATIPLEFVNAVGKIIASFYPEEDRKYVMCSFYEISSCYEHAHGELFQRLQGNPSGCAETTLLNCIANNLVLLYCWYLTFGSLRGVFDKLLQDCYGDDYIYTVKKGIPEEEIFTPELVAHQAATFGMKMDCAVTDKSVEAAIGWQPLEDVVYLRRHFFRGINPDIPATVFLGALDREKIQEIVNWQHKGAKNCDLVCTVRNCLSEACMYGYDYVMELWRKLREAPHFRAQQVMDEIDASAVYDAFLANYRGTVLEEVKWPHVLSNFTECEFKVQGEPMFSVEQGYQYSKALFCKDMKTCDRLRGRMTGIQAKAAARKVTADVQRAAGWGDTLKYRVMVNLLRLRYEVDPAFRGALRRGVQYRHPIIGRDSFWSSSNGGRNMFGRALMDVAEAMCM